MPRDIALARDPRRLLSSGELPDCPRLANTTPRRKANTSRKLKPAASTLAGRAEIPAKSVASQITRAVAAMPATPVTANSLKRRACALSVARASNTKRTDSR
jgi:hypothetical protein